MFQLKVPPLIVQIKSYTSILNILFKSGFDLNVEQEPRALKLSYMEFRVVNLN